MEELSWAKRKCNWKGGGGRVDRRRAPFLAALNPLVVAVGVNQWRVPPPLFKIGTTEHKPRSLPPCCCGEGRKEGGSGEQGLGKFCNSSADDEEEDEWVVVLMMMMMHGHGGGRVGAAGKGVVNLLWVNQEGGSGERDVVRDDSTDGGLDMGFGRGTQQQLGLDEFRIDDRWLVEPSMLYLGPKIGKGGHAKVYQGLYKKAIVAVKIIQPGGTAAELARRRERFLREISMLSRVQHDNLVTFIGACIENNMVIVTELLPGGSLRKYLTSLRPGRLDLGLAISFALDIAQAMECLHANGIIHRDLKPDNLLLTEDGKKVKLADFGLAREETLTEMMTAETGTYRWMAPELYSTVTLRRGDKKHYNNKVDVYSFSIVLWELLTNRLPFEGMSNLQAAYAAAFKKVRPDLGNVPKELVPVLECCWAEDPNSRPGFQQVIGMLSDFRTSLCPLETTPPPTIVIGGSSYVPTDSPGTRHLMDKSQENDSTVMNPEKSSRSFGCFHECFP